VKKTIAATKAGPAKSTARKKAAGKKVPLNTKAGGRKPVAKKKTARRR
jgi:hypothetical protein